MAAPSSGLCSSFLPGLSATRAEWLADAHSCAPNRARAQVDEARSLMHGTIDNLLSNQEQLTSLQGKTDAIAGQSKGFYRDARTSRRQAQCEEMRMKLGLALCGGARARLCPLFSRRAPVAPSYRHAVPT